VLSPKKSVEGAVGGVVGAALLGAIYAAVVGSHLEAENPVITYAIICAVGAL
ncbi:MAG TPA: phosphatidate cytidylyltransferase, partial [Lachnospiraceae bacterium]|nr:phosphatidate cytidylyltransferase [Lachnospiraceae bacterium]